MQRWWVVFPASVLVLGACGQPARTDGPKVALAPPSASATAAPACSDSAPPYVPHSAWSGPSPDLPPPPTLADGPLRIGADYTVRGALHALHGRYGQGELQKPISIVGFIVDTNLSRAPKCAVHRRGIADPKGCTSEIPSFFIADSKDDKAAPRIKVEGWASNFPNVVEAYLKYKSLTAAPATLEQDANWATDIPYPLPAVGAKVRVTGRYGVNFTLSSAGVDADPETGILTLTSTVTLERAPTPATLPGFGP